MRRSGFELNNPKPCLWYRSRGTAARGRVWVLSPSERSLHQLPSAWGSPERAVSVRRAGGCVPEHPHSITSLAAPAVTARGEAASSLASAFPDLLFFFFFPSKAGLYHGPDELGQSQVLVNTLSALEAAGKILPGGHRMPVLLGTADLMEPGGAFYL